MTPIPTGNPFDPSYIEGLPESITSLIRLTAEGTGAFVHSIHDSAKVIGWAHSYTEALRLIVDDKDEGVGQDITKLVLQVAKDMEHKLLKSELKRNTGGVWRSTMWYDELKEELLKHVYKGDPVDVLIYCAFAIYHGWDIRPADSSYPVKIDPQPLLIQHYNTSQALGDVTQALGAFNKLLHVWGTEAEPSPNTSRSDMTRRLSMLSHEVFRLSQAPLQLHVIPEPPARHIDLTQKV